MQPEYQLDLENLVQKIIDYTDENQTNYLSKFTVDYIISAIEKDKINHLERAFKDFDKKGVDIIDFVKIFLSLISHQERETLYLVMALVEFFRIISENINNSSNFIKFQEITDYICLVKTCKKTFNNMNISIYKLKLFNFILIISFFLFFK
jgi:hypothetical protein